MFTKVEKDNFVRNAVMEDVLNDKVGFVKVDNNAVLFEIKGLENEVKFVEVKFVVKNKDFNKQAALAEFDAKVAAAAKRLADAEKVKKEKAEKAQ